MNNNLPEVINKINSLTNFSKSKIENSLPFEQKIKLNSLSKNEDYEEKSVNSILKKIEIADNALVNSELSYAIYKSNMWIIDDLNKDFTDMTVKVEEALNDTNQFYNLKLWHFNKNFIEKIKDKEINLPNLGTYVSKYGFVVNYEFLNGHFSAKNDLAHACVLRSKHPTKEGYVLHICFRGTDFKRLPEFIKDAYLDMSAYYENFKPLELAMMKYAKDPKNQVVELQVSGHSLGGAMVQEFLKNNPVSEDTPPIKGFTFGSPGSKKHFYHKFLSMGYHLVFHKKLVWSFNEQKDERINEFYHNNDPVPKIGVLGYQKGGDGHNLFDHLYEENKLAKIDKPSFLERVPLFGKMLNSIKERIFNKTEIKFHDSKRYSINIKNLIENYYKSFPILADEMIEKTHYWKKYIEVENKFKGLSVRYKKLFEQIVNSQEPELNKISLQNKILNIRESMHYDSEAARVLSVSSQSTNINDFFLFKDKLKKQNDPDSSLMIGDLNPLFTGTDKMIELRKKSINSIRNSLKRK